MKSLRATSAVILMGILAGVAHADREEVLLQAGSYEVVFRLELPHVENWAVNRTSTICVTDAASVTDFRLPVLSGNNPLAKCPSRNARLNGATLEFDIICAGRDAARARAVYSLKPREFVGRVAMVMGGKNMTMTEVQVGRRVGACDLESGSQD